MEPSPEPELAFPGEPGFAGFPTERADDTVEYEIRVLLPTGGDAAVREQLRAVQTAATKLTRELLRGYIWQREAFGLALGKEGGQSRLFGKTDYGDAVEDEWLIVYLLRDLSKQFPNAWIRVTDNDGEFLLVEAANVLPKWLNPDVAENRVWINKGDLLIIPRSTPRDGREDGLKFISLPQALQSLQGSRESLLHSTLIEEEAFFRLRNYPAQIQQNFHHALISIPRRLAFILYHLPASIAPAIEAFYLRDPIALQPLREKDASKLTFPPQDMVTARIKFTKVGYAQVRSQNFSPQGVWAFTAAAGKGDLTTTTAARAEAGMKLASGFEMLVDDPQNQDRQVVREIKMLLQDVDNGDENLPTYEEIKAWGTEEDDDKWMDIDFRDLERELDGGKRDGNETRKPKGNGFGDKSAQENLRKLVSRFEQFLNADEMADDDDDDDDDEDDDSEDVSDEGEDRDVSFTEDEFTAMMREMMGMSPETMREMMGPHAPQATGLGDAEHPDFTKNAHDERLAKLFNDLDVVDQSRKKGKDRATNNENRDEDAEIEQLSALMEAELRKTGVFKETDTMPAKSPKIIHPAGASASHVSEGSETDGSDEEEMLDENYNLVSNLLHSYKGQVGTAGPSGNLMNMMGIQMPRDESSDSDVEHDPSKQG